MNDIDDDIDGAAARLRAAREAAVKLPPFQGKSAIIDNLGAIVRRGGSEVAEVRAWAKALTPEQVEYLDWMIGLSRYTIRDDLEDGSFKWAALERDWVEDALAVRAMVAPGSEISRAVREQDKEIAIPENEKIPVRKGDLGLGWWQRR